MCVKEEVVVVLVVETDAVLITEDRCAIQSGQVHNYVA